MARGRARFGRSAILVALAVHYLLLASALPAFHVCERHAPDGPGDRGRDDVLALRAHELASAAHHGHGDCVACRFTQLPKTGPTPAVSRSAAVPLRIAALPPRDDLPPSCHLLACVLPRGPPASPRV